VRLERIRMIPDLAIGLVDWVKHFPGWVCNCREEGDDSSLLALAQFYLASFVGWVVQRIRDRLYPL